jgi:hypothetical protein
MGNKNSKKYNKIKSFSLPVSLKQENGNISCNNCFSKIPFNKLEYEEQYKFSSDKIKVESNSSINNTKSLGINNKIDFIVQNDTDFNSDSFMDNYYKNKTSYYICKYILCTININSSQIHFNDYYKKLFKRIAKSYENDNDKASRLEEIFKSTGFYVPLQIDVGGMFMSNIYSYDMNYSYRSNYRFRNYSCFNGYFNNTINNNNLNNNEYSNLFLNNEKRIIGGNIYEQNLESWKLSINEKNAMPVGYKNFVKITDFINNKIKLELFRPLKIVEKKYELRRKYLEIIETLQKRKKKEYIYGKFSNNNGINEERNEPYIYRKKFKVYAEYEFLSRVKREITKSYDDIIVGWEIDNILDDDINGTWTLGVDPILTNDINCSFLSNFCRGLKYNISVYLMRRPE